MLLMIGQSATSPQLRSGGNGPRPTSGGSDGGSAATEFQALYAHLFPAVLRLAVDPEPVAQQLFNALTFQSIHYFTQNLQPENRETMAPPPPRTCP